MAGEDGRKLGEGLGELIDGGRDWLLASSAGGKMRGGGIMFECRDVLREVARLEGGLSEEA